MRKVTTTVAAALVAFSFAACNKTNNESVPANTDGTYAQLTFKEASLRGVTEGQNDAAGTPGESEIKNALFLTADFTGNQSMSELQNFTADADKSEEAKAFTSEKFLYAGSTGTVKSGLIVNGTGRLDATEKITLAKDGTTMKEYATNDGFLMSSKSNEEITINKNVKKEEVDDNNNRFRYTVERVAAKLQVVAPTGGIKVNENLPSPVNSGVTYNGTIADARYAVAGGAMTSYIFGDKAGSRTLAGSADPMKYTGFESAIHGETATSGSGADVKWRKNIQKVSDLVAWTNANDDQFKTLNSLDLTESAEFKKSVDNGIFFLENSIDQTGGFLMHDVAHAKIYATFAFAADQKVYTVENGKVVEGAVADVNKEDRTDKVEVTKEWMTKNNIEENDPDISKEGEKYFLTVKISKGSFFVGDGTGKVYLTLSAARLDGNKTTRLFKNGKMYWEVPANKQLSADGKSTGYCDTRRNNIYSLNVKSISGLGDNWDNSDPDDPNIPKPDPKDNPDEPTKPDPKPVDPVENYVQVEAVILQWNLVHRGIDLK